MPRDKIQWIICRSTYVVFFILCNTTCNAADATLNAYLGIPFGGGGPYFGVSAKLNTPNAPYTDVNLIEDTSGMELDLRHNLKGDTVYTLNGVTIENQLMQPIFNNKESSGTQSKINWLTIVGATLSVAVCTALIVAAADSSNSSFSFCSGRNCRTEDPPPPESEPTNPGSP